MMKKLVKNIVSLCFTFFLINACVVDSKSPIEQEEDNKCDNIKTIAYSDDQLNLLEEHHKICIVLNGYRFFLKSVRESMSEDDFQGYIDHNWTKQQELLLRYSKNIADISPYLIEYENQHSVNEQFSLIPNIEKEINDHFKSEDDSIDWDEKMRKSIPPNY